MEVKIFCPFSFVLFWQICGMLSSWQAGQEARDGCVGMHIFLSLPLAETICGLMYNLMCCQVGMLGRGHWQFLEWVHSAVEWVQFHRGGVSSGNILEAEHILELCFQ